MYLKQVRLSNLNYLLGSQLLVSLNLYRVMGLMKSVGKGVTGSNLKWHMYPPKFYLDVFYNMLN